MSGIPVLDMRRAVGSLQRTDHAGSALIDYAPAVRSVAFPPFCYGCFFLLDRHALSPAPRCWRGDFLGASEQPEQRQQHAGHESCDDRGADAARAYPADCRQREDEHQQAYDGDGPVVRGEDLRLCGDFDSLALQSVSEQLPDGFAFGVDHFLVPPLLDSRAEFRINNEIDPVIRLLRVAHVAPPIEGNLGELCAFFKCLAFLSCASYYGVQVNMKEAHT